MIGIALDGRYRIDKLIGRGGFGDVYRGFDLTLERMVALKIITKLDVAENFKKRFQLEMVSQAKLNHPNIATLYDCGMYEGRPYTVMELVDGVSFQELIGRSILSSEEITPLCLQVCQAMAHAHGQGVIHRDLKLENIMVQMDQEEKPQIKIVDFGLAKLLYSELQTTGRNLMGTPRYLSPEQIRGEPADGRADIFAFGVCLFRILNGRFPFDSEHPTAILYQIVNKLDLEFSQIVPQDLKDLVLHCLEKDPRNRPAGFKELGVRFELLQRPPPADDTSRSKTISLPTSLEPRGGQRNPYLNRVMIKNPDEFFGREREIRKIYSRLDAPHPQSISVVGERRIGKSSLLNSIYHRANRRKHMQNYHDAIFIFLDFQGSAELDVPRFIDFLFNVFSYETQLGREYLKKGQTLDQLRAAVEQLHAEGRRIIILMDEFELITRNSNFDAGFFSFLRALANNYRVAYVTSSCDELQLMCHNKDISDSPFFNIFSNLPLRSFTPEAAMAMISTPSAAEGVPLNKHAGKIIDMAGYFPLYLQIACSCVFENLLDRTSDDPDWPRVFATFCDETFPHFEFVWERMEEAEKKNLERISRGAKINRKYEFINEDLTRRGYLLPGQNPDELHLFSEAFKYFILRQNQQEGKRGTLLGRWLGRKST
jgi:serine/threonine protein kinase